MCGNTGFMKPKALGCSVARMLLRAINPILLNTYITNFEVVDWLNKVFQTVTMCPYIFLLPRCVSYNVVLLEAWSINMTVHRLFMKEWHWVTAACIFGRERRDICVNFTLNSVSFLFNEIMDFTLAASKLYCHG